MCFTTDSGGGETLGLERRGPSLVSKFAAGLVAAIVIAGTVLIPSADLIFGSSKTEQIPVIDEPAFFEIESFTFAEVEDIVNGVHEEYADKMLSFHGTIASKNEELSALTERVLELEYDVKWLEEDLESRIESDLNQHSYWDDDLDDSWIDGLEEEQVFIEEGELPGTINIIELNDKEAVYFTGPGMQLNTDYELNWHVAY